MNTVNNSLQLDRGLHYGDGLFETIAIKSGIAELLNEHISRLKESCLRLNINNVNFIKIRNDIEQQIQDIDKGIVKIIVTRGIGGRGYSTSEGMHARYLILHYPWPDYNNQYWKEGVAVKKCELIISNQPVLAGMKHLNRLENVMARMELNNSDFQEGLLCDSDSNVIEATSSNVFIVINNRVLTPKLDKSGVSGVMREQILKVSAQNEIQIDVKDVPYTLLLEADEIFLTNSVIGIWPVRKLNERIYTVFPITQKLMTLLNIQI
ncbi:MAG: aminodeoxychorismate lyase [Gammaproteobacteria bacterium]